MSREATTWVWEHSEMCGDDRMALLSLCLHHHRFVHSPRGQDAARSLGMLLP